MRRRGVCYDAGRVLEGLNWRPVFDAAEIHRELQIIRDELHCNAVRICGRDLDRLEVAGRDALAQGLEVWLSPELWNESPDDTLAYVADAARVAAALHDRWPGRVVFSVGSELSLFMRGILEGDSFPERIEHPGFIEHIRAGAHNAPLNEFLRRAAEAVRAVFAGPLTYASVIFESVDWSRFDFVAVDLYRDADIRDRYEHVLRRYFTHGRPVAIAEFGCCTYRGAEHAGGMGWAVIDDTTTPPHIKDGLIRDEQTQAAELTDLLGIYDRAGVDAAFVYVFSTPINAYCDDPRYDFDMANYALVKSYGNRLGDAATAYAPLAAALPLLPWDTTRSGVTYPDMPWEPKQAFHAVARYFAAQS